MPSSFSPSLRVELISNSAQAGTWGTTTNTNLGTILEDAIAGYEAVLVTSADQALTTLNGAADQARKAILELTTTTGAAFAVYAPPSPKQYIISNASAHAATLFNSTVAGNTVAAGVGVSIPAGKTIAVWSDGANFAPQNNAFIGDLLGNVTGDVSGNAGSVTNGVFTVGDQTIAGDKTFSNVTGFGANWTIEQSGNDLLFKHNGTAVLKLTSAGVLVAKDDITAFGTP